MWGVLCELFFEDQLASRTLEAGGGGGGVVQNLDALLPQAGGAGGGRSSVDNMVTGGSSGIGTYTSGGAGGAAGRILNSAWLASTNPINLTRTNNHDTGNSTVTMQGSEGTF